MITKMTNQSGEKFEIELLSEMNSDGLDVYTEKAVDKVYYIAALTHPVLSQNWEAKSKIRKIFFHQNPFWGFSVETVMESDEDFIIGCLF